MPDAGVSVRDRREALARLLADRDDLDICIAIVRAEIEAECREETPHVRVGIDA